MDGRPHILRSKIDNPLRKGVILLRLENSAGEEHNVSIESLIDTSHARFPKICLQQPLTSPRIASLQR